MNILIIEDSSSVGHIINSILTTKNHVVDLKSSNNVDFRRIKENLFDLIVVNTSTTYGSVKLIKDIRREDNKCLILGISTKSTWKEKVEFLNNGGDDVLDYPFPIQELEARIQSLERRPKESNQGYLEVKGFTIDTQSKKLNFKGKDIPLRKREFSLLEYMVKNKGRTISRAELLDHVWDYRRATGSNTVDVHIKRLRDKLHDRNVIETVHGFGYTVSAKKPKDL